MQQKENKKTQNAEKEIIMSGMRPTGKLHLGHYTGVIKNMLYFQEYYESFFLIADWHSLTTKFDDTQSLRQNVIEVALDWLSCGISPDRATIYLQSLVPETAEIHLLLSMVTPQNWVERDTTLKDMVKMLRGNETDNSPAVSHGLLGYPILQTADIVQFNATLVPVGKDQLAHLEISRDIARRFNHIYKTDLIKEPKPKLTQTPLLKGLDGQKMGKSFNNDIKISDSEEETTKKIMSAITDRSRLRKTDPGHPEQCEVIFPYYEIFANEEVVRVVSHECQSAIRGCADCKKQAAEIINSEFREIRQKRIELAQNPLMLKEIINEGSLKAKKHSALFLQSMKKVMGLYY